jgi:glycerol-3-phosphate dehydrogenase
MDGIKYRTRCGMGRCQGGFCGPRVAAILARELSIPLEQVTKQGDGSNLVVGKTKSVVKQKLNV